MKSRPSRLLAALFVTVLSLHVSGCFGSFALTRKIYGFNQGISGNKFVQWALFLGFVILPVYEIGSFLTKHNTRNTNEKLFAPHPSFFRKRCL